MQHVDDGKGPDSRSGILVVLRVVQKVDLDGLDGRFEFVKRKQIESQTEMDKVGEDLIQLGVHFIFGVKTTEDVPRAVHEALVVARFGRASGQVGS